MVLVSTGVYFALSRSLAATLLSSKGETARALSALFTSNVSAAVDFEDREVIQEALGHLAKNPDVLFAGVWAGKRGELGERLGQYSRAGHTQGTEPKLQEAPELDWSPQLLSVTAPVRSVSSQIIAHGLIEFSLAPENAKIAATRQRVLVTSFAVATVIVLMLIIVSRRTVLVPLQRLQAGARQLERGELAMFEISSNDEVGELASSLNQMTLAIRDREAQIGRRNRDMRLVMDNVGQGFLTLDRHGVLSDEYSRIIEEWFGKPLKGEPFAAYLTRIDVAFAHWFEASFAQLNEGFLPIEVAVAQFPERMQVGEKSWRFEYRPLVTKDDRVETLVVVITDITPILEKQRAEREQQEIIGAFTRVTRDRHGFMVFMEEATALVQAIGGPDSEDFTLVCRHIHTLKGICGIVDAHSLIDFCHGLEAQLAEQARTPNADEKQALLALWAHYEEQIRPFIGSDEAGVRLHRQRYLEFLQALRSKVPHGALLEQASSWVFEDTQQHLDRLAEHARAVAKRLGKGSIQVDVESSDLRLPPGACAELWRVLVHVVRNAVDHGLEPSSERETLGKPARGRISLSTTLKDGMFAVAISDDGRGINWEGIRQRARELGLAAETPADLERALFFDGLTTRTEANELSGRGIGTAAVGSALQAHAGRVEVESAAGKGTTFRCLIPSRRIFDEAADDVRGSNWKLQGMAG
jgi:two-component system chemotaxis sensor kinase CheA